MGEDFFRVDFGTAINRKCALKSLRLASVVAFKCLFNLPHSDVKQRNRQRKVITLRHETQITRVNINKFSLATLEGEGNTR
jgi:hypothetical protein